MKNILHIDSSGRHSASITRKLTHALVSEIRTETSQIIYRDLSSNLAFINETMINAYFTPDDQRSDAEKESIVLSDAIVKELVDSDIVVIGAPMYNFAAPAALKAWADLAARAGETFQYTEDGPKGLLEGKKAYIVVTAGGVVLDSDADFLTPWLRFFLGFIGISDVELIKVEGLSNNEEDALAPVLSIIKALDK